MTYKNKLLTLFCLSAIATTAYLYWPSQTAPDHREIISAGETKKFSNYGVTEKPQVINTLSQGSVASDNSKTHAANTIAYDARHAELEIITDNDFIDYIYDENGHLLMEIDKDESSFSFKKPLKIYQYKDAKVTSLTRYQYYAGETIKTRIDVAYNEDGSIADYREISEIETVPAH